MHPPLRLKIPLKPLIAVGFTLLGLQSAQAATYYVSPTGNNANSGTNTSSPWQTVSKVNSTSFAPGDQILFQRGGQWRESLIVPSSGSAGNPITFADYGSGAKPKFLGSVVLNNANFTSLGGNIYRYNIAQPVFSVLANQQFFNTTEGQSVEAIPNSFGWDGSGFVKINSATNPITDGKLYTAVLREDVINSNAKNWLVFRNLVADESAKKDGGYGVRIMNSSDVLLEDVEALRSGKHNFGCINSTRVVHRRCYAAYAMPRQGNGGNSAYVSYGDQNGPTGQTSEYYDCVFEHPEDTYNTDAFYYVFFTHGPRIGSVLLQNMQAYDGAGWSVDNSENGASIQIKGGLLENNRLQMYGSGIKVDGLRIIGPKASVDISARDCVIQNTIVEGTNWSNFEWYQTAVLSNGQNNTFRFNTVNLASNAPGYNTAYATTSNATSFNVYGNILFSNGAAYKQWGGSLGDVRYNMYRTGQGRAGETGSVEVNDPLWVNPSGGNYALQAASLAIDAAALSASLTSEVPTDFLGNNRRQGNQFDMGAYERASSGPTAPVISSPGEAAGSISQAFTYTIQANNGPTSYSALNLPAGLSINTSTGVISGTPTTAGTYNITLQASNGAGTGTKMLTLRVYSTSHYPYGVNPINIPGTIEMELFDRGNENQAYHDGTTGNLGNSSFRNPTDVDITTTSDSSGGTDDLGFIDGGEWVKYTVNVTASGTYNVQFRYASPGAKQVRLELDGVLIATVNLPSTGNFGIYQTHTITGIGLMTGVKVLKVYLDGGGWSYNWTKVVSATGNTAPTVSLTAPSNGASFTAPANISLAATASDVDGTVSKVEFFNGATKLGEDTVSPYTFAWNNVAAGTYSLTAKATDNNSAVSTSSAASITVYPATNNPPTVSLTSPASGSTFDAPATIELTATASDSDGTISKVEFFNGATKLGEDTSAPYTYNWTNVTAGTYSLTAKATDNSTAVTTSGAVSITVTNPTGGPGTGTGLRGQYFDNSDFTNLIVTRTDPTVNFNWVAAAPAPSMGGDHFSVRWTGEIEPRYSQTYSILATSDDGVRVWINNQLVVDSWGPHGPQEDWAPITLQANQRYPIKVEYRELEYDAQVKLEWESASQVREVIPSSHLYPVTGNSPPTVSLTSPTAGSTFTAPATVSLAATAADSDGTITKVEFYNGITKLGEDTSSPYTYTWSSVAAGTYSITAKAFDNSSGATTSGTVSITVSTLNAPPTVSLTSPANGATFTAPATVNLAATAADANGTISKVEFFNGTTKLGEATSSPYTYTWSSVAAGTYSISAKATDNNNAVTASSAVSITVSNPPTGGALTASTATPPSNTQLDTEGTTDWSHWGANFDVNTWNHKSGITPVLGTYSKIGNANLEITDNQLARFSWNGGTPNYNINTGHWGTFQKGIGNGFQLSLPAGTTNKTLKVYVKVNRSRGKLEVTLSDGSAAQYVDTTLSNTTGDTYRVYTLTYRAASANQTLTVRWTMDTAHDPNGHVMLQAASLQ